MIFHKYDDPGHGWLKCSRKLLVKYELLEKISPYSYQRGDFVFLEEDRDMWLLINELRSKGKTPSWRTYNTDKRSKIRNYAFFTPTLKDPS